MRKRNICIALIGAVAVSVLIVPLLIPVPAKLIYVLTSPPASGGKVWTTCIAVNPDANLLAIGYSYGYNRIRVLRMPTMHQIVTFKEDGWVKAISWSCDGSFIASYTTRLKEGSFSESVGRVKVWDLEGRKVMWECEGGGVVCFHPNGPILAVGGKETLKLFRIPTMRIVWVARLPKRWTTNTLKFSPRGELLAIGGLNASREHPSTVVFVFRVRDGKLLTSWRCTGSPTHAYCEVSDIAFHPDKLQLVIGTGYGETFRWDIGSGETITYPNSGLAVAFSPDGRLIATASHRGIIIVRDSRTGKIFAKWKGHRIGIKAITFNQKDGLLFSCAADGRFVIWKISGYEIERK